MGIIREFVKARLSDGSHKWRYDLESLVQVLAEAGFVDIVQRPFDPALDSEHRRWGTFYVDARKPGQDPA